MSTALDEKLKQAEAKRKYKRNNREKIRRSNAKYRRNNKEKIKSCGKQYRDKNEDKLRKYREDNKDQIKLRIRSCVKQSRLRVSAYKLNIGCQICGYNKCGDALDFHHINDKNKIIDVSRLRERKWSDFLKEAKKCVVVCRNCHAEIHYERRKNII